MAQTDDPTIAANAGSAHKGKLTSWQTEYVLREIEENNLDRKLFNAQKQLWEKNPKFYGDPASESRKSFGRFISNIVKRYSWQHYASILMKYEIDMSETTEAALALEIEQEEAGLYDDKKLQDPEEESLVTTEKNATLNQFRFSDDLVDDLTDTFASATTISGLSSSPVPTFGSPASQAQPTFRSPLAQRLSFDQPPVLVGNYTLADYIPDGSLDYPFPIYFNAKRGHHHGNLFIHQAVIEHHGHEYETTVLQRSGAIADIQNYQLEIATKLPACFSVHLGRAFIFKEPAANCFAREIKAFGLAKSENPSAKAPTVKALKAAEVQAARIDPELSWMYSVILFPLEQESFDNRVFSAHDTSVTGEKYPIHGFSAKFNKDLWGCTISWKVALAGKSRELEMRDDDIDADTFFNT
jgi:hypothetical protein